MIQAKSTLETAALTTVMGYLAQRTTVCATVLSRDGEVLAVHGRGLELLNTDAKAICGQVWTEFWQGAEREKAAAALANALDGKPASFTGTFSQERGGESTWDVEIVPLDREDGHVTRVLALSSFISGTTHDGARADRDFGDRKMVGSLDELFHTLSNLTAVSTSAANILRRGVDQERADALAEALSEAGFQAAQALESLRRQINDIASDGAAA